MEKQMDDTIKSLQKQVGAYFSLLEKVKHCANEAALCITEEREGKGCVNLNMARKRLSSILVELKDI